MIEKHASAVWKGTLKEGGGTLTTQSGALSGLPYTFATRFEGKTGANPEELIGAAHAACYSMFLSALMSGEGITPDSIATTSTISLDPGTEGGPTVKKAHLVTEVKAPAPEAKIRELAGKAKTACPISKLLAGSAEITLEVTVG
jgi:osmotically inducible protein OsmC